MTLEEALEETFRNFSKLSEEYHKENPPSKHEIDLDAGEGEGF